MRLGPAESKGSRGAIVEYLSKDGFSPLGHHATAGAEILEAMERAGYPLQADHGFLERQDFLIFAPKA